MTNYTADLYRILPELVLAVFGILVMVTEPFLPTGRKRILGWVALTGSLAAFATSLIHALRPEVAYGFAFSRLVVLDDFAVYFHLVILAVTSLVVLASFRYLEEESLPVGEYYALLLFAAVGMGLLAAANELILVFLSLEISSIATYVLAGVRRQHLKSSESAMKYFLLGSFATAFLLYGIAFLFGASGTTYLPDIAAKLQAAGTNNTLAYMGTAFLIVGLGFKVASAPFHVWTPDVYEGAPTPITAFLSTGPKAAAFAAFLRIFFVALEPEKDAWFWVIWGCAILTMFVGNLGALLQDNIKRMLAYSSIAHAGYILVAFAALNELGITAILFYLLAYAFMKLGAFTLVTHISAHERNQDIESYSGLHARNPYLAASLAIFMLSLIGIPLTAGFLGKFYLFTAAIQANLVGLVILGVVNSVVSAGYYLRVVKVMYMNEPQATSPPLRPLPVSLLFVLLVTTLGTIYLGIFPDSVMRMAVPAAQPLFLR